MPVGLSATLDRRAFQTGTKSKREWESIIPKTINYLFVKHT